MLEHDIAKQVVSAQVCQANFAGSYRAPEENHLHYGSTYVC